MYLLCKENLLLLFIMYFLCISYVKKILRQYLFCEINESR